MKSWNDDYILKTKKALLVCKSGSEFMACATQNYGLRPKKIPAFGDAGIFKI